MTRDSSGATTKTDSIEKPERVTPLFGVDDSVLRVLNFSSGGFDTVMQLGVTHAIVVRQGRAPDIVVGVSAGAIQAVALAEVLRAGELPPHGISKETYELALSSRVVRLRKFVDACHSAPEEIVDSLFPDAYQIDSFEPLKVLQLPILAAAERQEREASVTRKSGLVRLYNDLLSLHLPFGTITRIIRRSLGFVEAREIDGWIKRKSLRALELLRIWLLLGSHLSRMTPLVPILVRPLFGRKLAVKPATAGSIIFRFKIVERVISLLKSLLSLLLLLNLWVGISWTVLAIPLVLAIMLDTTAAWVILLLYLIPILLLLLRTAFARDRRKLNQVSSTIGRTLYDVCKAIVVYFYYLTKWTVVLLALAAMASVLVGLLIWVLGLLDVTTEARFVIVVGVFVGALVFALVVLVIVYLYGLVAYTSSDHGKNISKGRWYRRRFLDYYSLGSALAHNYGLKRFLVRLFDPGYYGDLPIDQAINRSLSESDESVKRLPRERIRISDYATPTTANKPKISVALAVADIEKQRLDVIDGNAPVVDALLAANALVPIFEPVDLGGKLYIDATNLGNVPTKALIDLLGRGQIANVSAVHIYPVEPLPISEPTLGPPVDDSGRLRAAPYTNLIEIASRALQLQRFRDANMERKLTRLFTKIIPEDTPILKFDDVDGKHRQFFAAQVIPIELDHSVSLNKKILFARKEHRRDAIAETIAEGCRAGLKVMLAGTLQTIREGNESRGEPAKYVSCIDAVTASKSNSGIQEPGLSEVRLPSSEDSAPGVPEICRHCYITDDCGEKVARQSLKLPGKSSKAHAVDWPHELAPRRQGREPVETTAEEAESGSMQVNSALELDDQNSLGFDGPSKWIAGPMQVALFAGGVFRGVFQMGVLNALGLLEARPNLVAGASVGSITAAMVAEALCQRTGQSQRDRVRDLAAVYLSLDRLILTDQFADFVRNWTIRASEARFSLKQADEVFRKYDDHSSKVFQKNLREVVAGLEKLFHVNPYQLNDIVFAARNQDYRKLGEILKKSVQEWLDRMGVGNEVLGADPLRLLIEHFVVPEKFRSSPDAAPFDCFGDNPAFLATTTNLTQGRLEILGRRGSSNNRSTMVEALLASSAFPAVFRPRRSWDLMPGTSQADQYIDGGVMDNLPVDAVLEEMRFLSASGSIESRPESGPHMVLAASLEVVGHQTDAATIRKMAHYWPELASRAKALKYNGKLDTYARAERKVRQIVDAVGVPPGGYVPLDVELVSVKPLWLCNTFAFHPMLGFQRVQQAKSIAHGCAATLLAFGAARKYSRNTWNLAKDVLPSASSFKEALPHLKRNKKEIQKGCCWLQKGKQCPFSKAELKKDHPSDLDPTYLRWVSEIHRQCWDVETHTGGSPLPDSSLK